MCEACKEPCNGMCPRIQKLLITGMSRPELEAYSRGKVDCMWHCRTCHALATGTAVHAPRALARLMPG